VAEANSEGLQAIELSASFSGEHFAIQIEFAAREKFPPENSRCVANFQGKCVC
jgi:hypothetical protein